jgi:CheY-like chemotaxis protein
MSGMTGLDATRQIRQINKTIPIIAQTAYALAGDRESAIDAGCNDYISKPLNSSKLLRLIEDYIVNGSSHERNPFK